MPDCKCCFFPLGIHSLILTSARDLSCPLSSAPLLNKSKNKTIIKPDFRITTAEHVGISFSRCFLVEWNKSLCIFLPVKSPSLEEKKRTARPHYPAAHGLWFQAEIIHLRVNTLLAGIMLRGGREGGYEEEVSGNKTSFRWEPSPETEALDAHEVTATLCNHLPK